LDDFLRAWNDAKRKQLIIDELEGHGIDFAHLEKEIANGCGAFDLICHIAYDQPPLTRAERANNVKKRNYFTKYGDKARAILEALLNKYADEDIGAIESAKVLKYRPFNEIGTRWKSSMKSLVARTSMRKPYKSWSSSCMVRQHN